MLSEDRTQVTASPTLWQKATRAMFEPHAAITEVGARRQARLVSIIILVFGFLNLVGAASIYFANGLTRNVFVLLGLAVVSSIGYTLSRTRFYRLGSYMITWSLVLTAFGVGDATRLSASLYSNLILSFVIASITFPFRYMTIFVIVNNLAIGLMPFL